MHKAVSGSGLTECLPPPKGPSPHASGPEVHLYLPAKQDRSSETHPRALVANHFRANQCRPVFYEIDGKKIYVPTGSWWNYSYGLPVVSMTGGAITLEELFTRRSTRLLNPRTPRTATRAEQEQQCPPKNVPSFFIVRVGSRRPSRR